MSSEEENSSQFSTTSCETGSGRSFETRKIDVSQKDLISLVDDLNADERRLQTMTPLDHLEWAKTLPSQNKKNALHPETQKTLKILRTLKPETIMGQRAAALLYWQKRKRALDPEWEILFEKAPTSVKKTLGIKKNLLLLKEMME